MSIQEKQSSIIYNNLKKSLVNFDELSLPRFTQEQVDQIVKSGTYQVHTSAAFNQFAQQSQDKIEKGYFSEEDVVEYQEELNNISKAILVDEKGIEQPIYFYSLTEGIEEIQKSESGEESTIHKSVYKDNSYNRKLERVGQELQPEE